MGTPSTRWASPSLSDWIVARTRHYDARYLSSDPRFRHAHITVLAPLRRGECDLAAMARIAASTAAFDFALRDLAVFANGCIHLPPFPDAPFRELTRRAWAAHPTAVPNGAPDPAPHLTVDMIGPAVTLASTRALLDDVIPVVCRARALGSWSGTRRTIAICWSAGKWNPGNCTEAQSASAV